MLQASGGSVVQAMLCAYANGTEKKCNWDGFGEHRYWQAIGLAELKQCCRLLQVPGGSVVQNMMCAYASATGRKCN